MKAIFRHIAGCALAALCLAACGVSVSPRPTPALDAITLIATKPTATRTPPPPTPTATLIPSPTSTPTRPTPTPSATPTPVIRLMAVGDVMLGRTIGQRLQTDGAGAAFAGVQPVLKSADVLTANLECVISPWGAAEPKAYRFRAPPQAVDALAQAGVDVVSLANNHAMDYGYVALADMRKQLTARQILSVGAGQNQAAAHAPAILDRNGLRVAFLAYVDVMVESRTGFDTRTWTAGPGTPGVAWADPKRIAVDVKAARQQADLVVVFLHSGLEDRAEVSPNQRAEAQAAIDAGAALVLGSHPHVLQPVEKYHGGLIVYSLGNFVFDGFALPENYSVIFSAALTLAGVGDYTWIPVVIENGLPRLANADESAIILAKLGAGN
jgi:poly-gamma-glutamate capsule biosynthesis protein CapA/YwtB (metallophosphatase superfamily)